VSIFPPRFWQQQISWSYCAASRTFALVAWRNSNKKVSLSCNQHAARSVVVMLHVRNAIAFHFDPHLGDFPFLFFTFFGTFQSLRLGVRQVSVWVSTRVSVKVIFRVSVRATVRVKARVRLRVYLLCLLRFCQASCSQHLGARRLSANLPDT